MRFPVLSDITRTMARDYGVLDEERGIAMRGLFVIDPEGRLQYQLVSALGVGRSTNETIRVLQALQTGELCPSDWNPGDKTLGKG